MDMMAHNALYLRICNVQKREILYLIVLSTSVVIYFLIFT